MYLLIMFYLLIKVINETFFITYIVYCLLVLSTKTETTHTYHFNFILNLYKNLFLLRSTK